MPGIPWTTILTHGPAILAAAKRLLVTAGASHTRADHQNVEARLQRLEQTSMESARLLEDIAQQIHALALAQELTARRARIAIAVSVVAVITCVGVGILAFVW
jgi:hypothetical protein